MTLRGKLVLWYSGVFFVSATFLVVTMYLLIAHKTRTQFFGYFDDEYEECRRIVEENKKDPVGLKQEAEREVYGRNFFPLSYELYNLEKGTYELLLAPEWEDQLPPVSCPDNGESTTVVQIGDGPDDVIYMRTGWVDRQKWPQLLFRVGMSYERTYDRLDDLGEFLAGALIVSLFLSMIGGWFLAARSLAPIDEVADSLEKVEASRLGDRLPTRQEQDEIGRIVSSANHMLSRLEDSFQRISRFAADVAHELRTPLATLKCRLEISLEREDISEEVRETFNDCLEQANDLTSLINNLLFLARLDAADELENSEIVVVDEILEELAEVFEVASTSRETSFEIECPGKVEVKGNRSLIRQLLANLIDNALTYTPSGGKVRVKVRWQNEECRIAISDNGVGMAEEDLDRVFDRFYRTEQSRSRETGGTGLGLSICKRIVELHGGTIKIDSQEGVGTNVTVILPG
jgi:heavy metal sensor kinase